MSFWSAGNFWQFYSRIFHKNDRRWQFSSIIFENIRKMAIAGNFLRESKTESSQNRIESGLFAAGHQLKSVESGLKSIESALFAAFSTPNAVFRTPNEAEISWRNISMTFGYNEHSTFYSCATVYPPFLRFTFRRGCKVWGKCTFSTRYSHPTYPFTPL